MAADPTKKTHLTDSEVAFRSAMRQQSSEIETKFRAMLHQMIELVPGQLFRDITRFHDKFGLQYTDDPRHQLPEDIVKFRYKFMEEELNEYLDALGYFEDFNGCISKKEADCVDMEKAFDSLIDLVYVALGTAYLHRFPFNEGWARVQQANMSKVRATGADDERSVRKHAIDVVKPAGWRPPVLRDLINVKFECDGCHRVTQGVLPGDLCPDGRCRGKYRILEEAV